MLATNPELCTLWRAGLAGEELDDDGRFRFGALLVEQQFLQLGAYGRYIEHDMVERANAMALVLALLIKNNPSIPEFSWLPGTEEFRDEVERQRAGIQQSKSP